MLPLAVFLQLATACAPRVAPVTLLAVARTESGLRPLAVHDNTIEQAYAPSTAEEAVALVSGLAGHSLDLGLMQVNAAMLGALGLSVQDAFDPCRSLAAGAEVLRRAYRTSLAGNGPPQRALRVALSHYNTGDPSRGFANGYVRRVERAAGERRTAPASAPGRAGAAAPTTHAGGGPRVFRGWTDTALPVEDR